MKSRVYFIGAADANDIPSVNEKLKRLLKESGVLDFIRSGSKVAVKAHFGEEGNTGFVRPQHFRVICDAISGAGSTPLLSDTNTLYRGRRLNSADHLSVAREHGFTREITGADCLIPDDTRKDETVNLEIGKKSIPVAKIAKFFIDADALVAVSHFKGHIMTGFGGALKNIGMGCATREGKLAQHCDVSPVVYAERCTGCGECSMVCPAGAIQIKGKKSVIDQAKCIGCASCMAACPTMAMFIDFEAGGALQKKMVEYAFAVLKDKRGKAGFLNFALRINKECDCWGMENPRIAPDVGVLASSDPVSIDKASFDLVNQACGEDIFQASHPRQDGMKQLEYAQELGLGSLDYELCAL
jgi:uncharacterized protein